MFSNRFVLGPCDGVVKICHCCGRVPGCALQRGAVRWGRTAYRHFEFEIVLDFDRRWGSDAVVFMHVTHAGR